MVRRHIGYLRLTGAEQLALVTELYRHLRLYANYFQPLMKLKSKERNGSQVKKTYHAAQTPYQRLRASSHVCGQQAAAGARIRTVESVGAEAKDRADPSQTVNAGGQRQTAALTSTSSARLDQRLLFRRIRPIRSSRFSFEATNVIWRRF
jgi:hypothetical protein